MLERFLHEFLETIFTTECARVLCDAVAKIRCYQHRIYIRIRNLFGKLLSRDDMLECLVVKIAMEVHDHLYWFRRIEIIRHGEKYKIILDRRGFKFFHYRDCQHIIRADAEHHPDADGET